MQRGELFFFSQNYDFIILENIQNKYKAFIYTVLYKTMRHM